MEQNKDINLDLSENWDDLVPLFRELGYSDEVIENVKEAKDFLQFYFYIKRDNDISKEHISEISMITIRYTDGVISLTDTLKDIADLVENPEKMNIDKKVDEESKELFDNLTDWEMSARVVAILHDTPEINEDEFFSLLKEKYDYDRESIEKCIDELKEIGLLVMDESDD